MIRPQVYPAGIWLVDFEFHPSAGIEGNRPRPVCMVATELKSGRSLRLWQNDLERRLAAPFPCCPLALFVSYFSTAELGCFKALGWPIPFNVLDLYLEFRNLTNGRLLPSGSGLLGALAYFGHSTMDAGEKESLRSLILSGGPWPPEDRQEILDYCASDVAALESLYGSMQKGVSLDYALLRGRYAVAASSIEEIGVPIDLETLKTLKARWPEIERKLVEKIDQDYEVYEGPSFRMERFMRFLNEHNIPWPRLESGGLDLKDETFKAMSSLHPILEPLRQLRKTISQFQIEALQVGEDARNRCMLSIFRSKTGRNQPSNTKFVFGPAAWVRGLIKPAEGWGIAYVDWCQQEFGIAAALSGDQAMMDAYRSGDPYLFFAIQAGAAPPDATKHSHKEIRDQFKACVLAVQYGMAAESLALRINQPVARARQLLQLHRQTYRTYWAWQERVLNHALLDNRLWTVFGWTLHVESKPNARSLGNFPMQANGAEMLRLACVRLVDADIRVCAPVHDAVMIEAPLEELDDLIRQTQTIMREASALILGGFELETDVKVVRYPDRYMDERGGSMWNVIVELAGLPELALKSA